MPVGCKSFGMVLWNAIANGCVIDVSAQKPPFHFAIVFVATNRNQASTDQDAEAARRDDAELATTASAGETAGQERDSLTVRCSRFIRDSSV
jgi:hypothetical protein